MPQLKLLIGKMSLEDDNAVKKDEVVAHLYNGYHIGANIYSIPGYKLFCDLGLGNATIDGDYYSSLHNVRIVCSNGKAWTLSIDGTATAIDGVTLTAGIPVTFAEDRTTIYFAAKSPINRHNGTLLTGQAPVNVKSLAYIKGFLCAAGDDPLGGAVPGDVWYSDDLLLATWEVFNNELLPDAVQSIFVTFSELYAIGRESIEVNSLGTDPNNPFENNSGVSQSIGTMAPYSVAFDKESIYMLAEIGGNVRILRLVGGRTKEILSFAIDVPIDQITDISDARAWIQSFKGQTFYVITFPSAVVTIVDQVHNGITFALNIKTLDWGIWYKWDDQKGECERYPADTFVFISEWGNKRFVGFNGAIWELDGHAFGDVPVRTMIRTGQRSWGKPGQEKFSNEYIYDMKFGAGTYTDQPRMIHRWKNDGRHEWANPRIITLGLTGDSSGPRKSRQCGRYYKRQDEFIFPDAFEIVLSEIWEDV